MKCMGFVVNIKRGLITKRNENTNNKNERVKRGTGSRYKNNDAYYKIRRSNPTRISRICP